MTGNRCDVTALGLESKNKKCVTYSALAILLGVQLLTLAVSNYNTSLPRHEYQAITFGN